MAMTHSGIANMRVPSTCTNPPLVAQDAGATDVRLDEPPWKVEHGLALLPHMAPNGQVGTAKTSISKSVKAMVAMGPIAVTVFASFDSALLTQPLQPEWLHRVYETLASGDIDRALDILFDEVDRLLSAGDFGACDRVLREVDLERLDSNLIVGLLSITLRADRYLPYRRELFVRSHHQLSRSDPRRVDRLLDGLNA